MGKLILIVVIALAVIGVIFFVKETIGEIKRQKEKRKINMLISAIKDNNINEVQKLIDDGVNLNPDWYITGSTPLIVAVSSNNKEIVSLLLENGAWVDHSGKGGKTALFYAVENGNKDMISLLLDNGADINEKDLSSKPPLHYVLEQNDTDMVSFLISKGANYKYSMELLDIVKNKDINPSERLLKIDRLLQKGATCDIEDAEHKTALYYAAVEQKDSDLTSLLIEKCCSQTGYYKPDTPIIVPLMDAINMRDINSVIIYALRINSLDVSYWETTPLKKAIEYGYEEIILALIAFGADVNYAGRKHGLKIDRNTTIKNIENVQIVDTYSRKTPLGEAIYSLNSNEHIIEILLENGADPNIFKVYGDNEISPITVLSEVYDLNKSHLAFILEKYGARLKF